MRRNAAGEMEELTMRSCQATGTKLEFYATTRADGRPADRKSLARGFDGSLAPSRLTVRTKEIGARNSRFIRPGDIMRVISARLLLQPCWSLALYVAKERRRSPQLTLGQLSAISRMGARKGGSHRYGHVHIYGAGPRGRRR